LTVHTYHAVPMPFPCRVNSPTPCRDPAILQQCPVLRESRRGRRKYPNCKSASGNNLRGTPHGSQNKPNTGRCPHAVSGRPMLIHTYLVVPMARCAVALRGGFLNGMVVAWQGNGMACVNQTRPHCVNKMGKTQSKPLAERHGRGTAWYV
jgi:hypothetical protein